MKGMDNWGGGGSVNYCRSHQCELGAVISGGELMGGGGLISWGLLIRLVNERVVGWGSMGQ